MMEWIGPRHRRRTDRRFALLGLGLLACGAPRGQPSPARAAAAIVAGSDDSLDPGVVGIGIRRVRCDATLAVHCTGTLVAARIVLTAAHCVSPPAAASNLEVLFGSDAASLTAVVRRVAAVQLHPDYHADGDLADLALLILNDNAPVAPVALNTAALDASWTGQRVRLVGFGQSDPSGAPPGTKRTGAATISEVGTTQFRIVPGPALSCHGDSGGPIFAAGSGGGEVLLGVTATGDPGCAAYGQNVRVDAFSRDFIEPWISRISGAAPPPPMPPLSANALLCTAPCTTDADCPDGLSCQTGPTGEGLAPRCVVPGLLAGALAEVCTSDAQCRDGCVRIRADNSAESCRCYQSCADDSPSDSPQAGQGCSLSHRLAARHALPEGFALSGLFLFFSLFVLRCRRNTACLPSSISLTVQSISSVLLGDSHNDSRRKQ